MPELFTAGRTPALPDFTPAAKVRRRARRYAAALPAAGVATAMLLTSAAGSASAAPAARALADHPNAPAANRNVATLSETLNSGSGRMTVTVRYRTGPKLHVKVLGVTYSGSSKVKVKQPSLLFVFAPELPVRIHAAPHPAAYYLNANRPLRIVVFRVRLKAGQLARFSGTLPARDLAALNRHGGLAPISTATTVLTHLRRLRPGVRRISIRPVLQTGIILTPHRG